MKVKLIAFIVAAVTGVVVGTAGPAAADYHYSADPVHVARDGITFYLMVEYDSISDHVRAEGRIVSTSGHAGRMNWIHLFLDTSTPPSQAIVANYSPPGGLATNTSISAYAGPVACNHFGTVYYRAQMSIHEDGTSWNYLLETPEVFTPCWTP